MTSALAHPAHVEKGSHVCLIYEDDHSYLDAARQYLAHGVQAGEKTFAFGPEGSPLLERLASEGTAVVDPHAEFLGRGPLCAEVMYATFREQAALAAREGFTGIRAAADMDWLLASSPSAEEAVAFEAGLDRVVSDLGASVLCAYRRASFEPSVVSGMLCVHPVIAGSDVDPGFTLCAGEGSSWRLSGAVDVSAAPNFAAALRGTVGRPWVLELTGLDFIDVSGMRALAEAARAHEGPLELRNAGAWLRRHWELAGFREHAPQVRFVT